MRRKLIYGVGVNDAPYATEPDKTVNGRTINSRKCPYFVLWKAMLRRCYASSVNDNPTYIGCTVDERWHSFMSFRTWMESQKQHTLWLVDIEEDTGDGYGVEVRYKKDEDPNYIHFYVDNGCGDKYDAVFDKRKRVEVE